MENEKYMKRCYELAISAGKKGHDTFGAVLVHNGEILEEAENTADYKRRIFGHAEFNLVHQCANKYSDKIMEEPVLFTSCAPCERCLGAIASLGIHTVVCGVSYKEFCMLLPYKYTPLDREGLLDQLGIKMNLVESVLEDEGMSYSAEKSRQLYEELLHKGYSREFSELISKQLCTEWTATRMLGYLRQVPKLKEEDIVDEMLAILSDRDQIMQKKKMEFYQGKMNELYMYGFDE